MLSRFLSKDYSFSFRSCLRNGHLQDVLVMFISTSVTVCFSSLNLMLLSIDMLTKAAIVEMARLDGRMCKLRPKRWRGGGVYRNVKFDR
jgi:hypothetical protein